MAGRSGSRSEPQQVHMEVGSKPWASGNSIGGEDLSKKQQSSAVMRAVPCVV